MLKRKIATATVVICLMGLARVAMAQSGQDNSFRPFNGFFADLLDDGSPSPSHSNSGPQRVPTRAPRPQPDADQSVTPPVSTPLAAPPTETTSRPQSPATGKNYSFQFDDASSSSGAALNPPTPSTLAGGDTSLKPAVPAGPDGGPLHERLKYFRQSPFGDAPLTASSPISPPSLSPPPPAAAPVEPAPSRPAETAAVAQHAPAAAIPSPETLPSPPADAEPQRLAAAKPATDVAAVRPVVPAAEEPSILINHKSPLLTVETIGPRKIVVGKEASYEVLLQNSGDVAAEEVAVTVSLPEWADVAGTTASTGEVRSMEQDRHDPCRWVLARIEARSKEKLTLKLIPRQSKPFELAVHWDFKQSSSQAMIEVQEPKLTMRMDGPREVLFGKREVFKLKLGNSGNGVAENVLLTLMPLNTGDTHPTTHRLGSINPGDERSIEIELTARQAGNLMVRVEANGDGGAHVDLAERVLVHRAALQIDVEGPAVQYVGTPARYKIHVRNPGDATAKNVKLTATLPTGVKFIAGSEGATSESTADGGKVRWTLDQLQPGEERVLEMKYMLAVPGVNCLEINSAADDEVVAAAEAITRGEAMADLRLEVKDPEGPVPVGADATYELHLHNRGTKAAENVEVMLYFSNGVEPISADGQRHRITPGQIVFSPIADVLPGAEMVLRVKAKADASGNHSFRAEVHCRATGTRLVREGVTHYYQDSPGLQQATVARQTPTSFPQPPAAEIKR